MADFQVEIKIDELELQEAFNAEYQAGYDEGWEAGYEAGFMAADSYIQFEGEGI